MNIKSPVSNVSGRIKWLEVRGPDGELKKRLENLPNILLNGAFNSDATLNYTTSHRLFESTAESYTDIDGTWSQTGNTITRSTGSGTFPNSPTEIGNELYWTSAGDDTGHRCHITARASDTSITVSGDTKSITGGTLRRFVVNGSGVSSGSGYKQLATTSASTSKSDEDGTYTYTAEASFSSAGSAYTLGSIVIDGFCRIVLPETVDIDSGDQVQYAYEATETISGRFQEYELGEESVGIPQQHQMTSIAGTGAYVDVTFDDAVHFLAGDLLDLRTVETARANIASITSTGTEWTITTATPHGLSVSDDAVIENSDNAAYNGTHAVSAVTSTTVFEVSDISDPGAAGAAGTVQLDKPGSYYDSLGLAEIASMESGGTVARITSTVTGPAVEPKLLNGDPGVTVVFKRRSNGSTFKLDVSASDSFAYTEANASAIADHEASGGISDGTYAWAFNSSSGFPTAAYTNDWVKTYLVTKNAGSGTSITRCKQLLFGGGIGSDSSYVQITFNTPWNKLEAERLRLTLTKQIVREIETP